MNVGIMLAGYEESIRTALTECYINNPLLLVATSIFGFYGTIQSFREYLKNESFWIVLLDTLLLFFLTAVLSPFIYPTVLLTVLPIGTFSVAYCLKKRRNQEINRILDGESNQTNEGREELIAYIYDGGVLSLIQSVALINAEKCIQANRPMQAILYLNQCNQSIQLHPCYIIRYAQALKLMANYHGALAKLNNMPSWAMKKKKFFIAAMQLRADCCRRLNQYTEELDCYDAIIARGYKLKRYYILLGQAKIRILERSPYLSRAKEAVLQRSSTSEAFAVTILEDLDRALNCDKKYQAEILSYKANCYICMQDYENGFKLLEESSRLKSNIANNFVCLGICYLEKNDIDLAETNLKKGIACDMRDDRAYFYLSKLYYSKEKYDEAIMHASKALALFPSRVECNDLQGKCYQAKRMYSEAILCYTKAIKLDPKAEYFLSRAECYYYLPDTTLHKNVNAYWDAKAAYDLEKTLKCKIKVLKYKSAMLVGNGKILPKDEIDILLTQFDEVSQFATEIGSIYYFNGYLEAAETYFRAEYEAHPNSIPYIFNYALILRNLGHIKEAIALLEKVYEPNLDDIGFYKLLLGCYCDIGDTIGSDKVKHEIDCAKKRYMILDKNTGDGLFQMGKFSDAVEYYYSALEYVDTSSAVHNNLACAYIRMEQYSKAIELLEKILQLENDYPPAYYNLGCCYLFMNESQMSYESFQSAHKLGMCSIEKEKIFSPFNDEITSVLLGLDLTSSSSEDLQIAYC